jgi:predicted AlkP superfamily phosphohydrolase/phosphomutase
MKKLGTLSGCLLVTVTLLACQSARYPAPSPEPTQKPPTTTARPASTDEPATQAPTPSPVVKPPLPIPQRVFIVSVEGGRADWLKAAMADGLMPSLAEWVEQGAYGTLQSVDPPTPAVVHNSLACGCFPSRSGIVGERVHRPEDSFYWYTSAFDLPMTGPAPIWQAASEAGMTTAVLFWPGATPALPEQLADFTVDYGERDAYSTLHNLSFQPAQGWSNAPDSLELLKEAQFQIKDSDRVLATVFVLAAKTDSEHDMFILSSGDRNVDDGDVLLDNAGGKWAYWSFDPAQGRGADFLIVDASPDSFTLYQSGVYHLVAAPDALQEALIERYGYFPPPPDYYALEQGWLSDEQYMQMLIRQSEWMMDVSLWVYETYQPDLLLTVQSPLRQAAQQFLLIDERQPGYATLAADYQHNLDAAARHLDSLLGRLAEATNSEIEQGQTTLFVAGTAPIAPVHTQVNINTALEQAGLLHLDERHYVVVGRSQAIAFSSGGAAHIYVYLAGREASGIVSEETYESVRDQIVAMLDSLSDPVTGDPIFARVVRREDLAALNLDGAYAGDIFVQAEPGYTLSDQRGPVSIFEPVVFQGQGGYYAGLPEMQGGLVIVGGGAAPGTDLGIVHLVDLAPTIAHLLGLAPDLDVDGQVLPALVDR